MVAGCDEQQARVEYLTPTVPASLRRCSPQPKWDGYVDRAKAASRDITQRDASEYIATVSAAGQDCRSKLAAVDQILKRIEARVATKNKATKK